MSDTVRRYRIEFEGSDSEGYSAYVPDLPVVLAVGDTFEEMKSRIAEAVEFHLELMAEKGLPIPEPTTPRPVRRGLECYPAASGIRPRHRTPGHDTRVGLCPSDYPSSSRTIILTSSEMPFLPSTYALDIVRATLPETPRERQETP